MSNGINRRGQKVECIAGFELVGEGPLVSLPVPHQTYTVDDFVLSSELSDEGVHLLIPGITLLECPSVTCGCCGKALGWPIKGFRPIVHPDTKADLSALIDAAAKVTMPKREDAKANPFARGGLVSAGFSPPLIGERTSEAMLTPAQVAVMNTAVDRAADDIARAFIRAYVIPLLVKRLGL